MEILKYPANGTLNWSWVGAEEGEEGRFRSEILYLYELRQMVYGKIVR